jgi:hypothetical protein
LQAAFFFYFRRLEMEKTFYCVMSEFYDFDTPEEAEALLAEARAEGKGQEAVA